MPRTPHDHWQVGATLNVQSGRPRSGFGTGNPIDGTEYHSFYICVDRCGLDPSGNAYDPSERVYELSRRGSYGRTPTTIDVGASITWMTKIRDTDLSVKFAVYNLFDRQTTVDVDDEYEGNIGDVNPDWLRGIGFQSPRFGQLTVTWSY
jgi:outer membrane receptor protein involved in Fe transport